MIARRTFMDEHQNVWGIATMLVEKHGVRATSHAEFQALKARHRGDMASMYGWQSVAEATAAILSGKTSEDAISHSVQRA
jgi:hypothetical protein